MALLTSRCCQLQYEIGIPGLCSGKSAKSMLTSLNADFSRELGVGLKGGEKSIREMPTSNVCWPYSSVLKSTEQLLTSEFFSGMKNIF